MTDAINPKLLVVLGLAVVVAGFGALRLFAADDVTGDVGFGPANELPISVAPNPEMSDPISDPVETFGRNPFARADGGETFTPAVVDTEDGSTVDGTATDGTAADGTAVDGTPAAGTAGSGNGASEPVAPADPVPPVFPDPSLVDQGPSRDDPRNDTSFEG